MKKAGLSILLAAFACTTMAGYATAAGQVELSYAPFTTEGFSLAHLSADFRLGERFVLGASVNAWEEGGIFAPIFGSLKLGLACSRELPGFLGSKTVEGTMYAGPRVYLDGHLTYIVGGDCDLLLTDRVVVSNRFYTEAFGDYFCNLSVGVNLNSNFRANLGVQQVFTTDFRTRFDAIYAVSGGVSARF